jgi:hypothetical protein
VRQSPPCPSVCVCMSLHPCAYPYVRNRNTKYKAALDKVAVGAGGLPGMLSFKLKPLLFSSGWLKSPAASMIGALGSLANTSQQGTGSSRCLHACMYVHMHGCSAGRMHTNGRQRSSSGTGRRGSHWVHTRVHQGWSAPHVPARNTSASSAARAWRYVESWLTFTGCHVRGLSQHILHIFFSIVG